MLLVPEKRRGEDQKVKGNNSTMENLSNIRTEYISQKYLQKKKVKSPMKTDSKKNFIIYQF